MKACSLVLLLGLPFFSVACAHSLEQIVDAKHQARIDAANAHQPIARGAADGLGANYVAQNQDAQTQATKTQP